MLIRLGGLFFLISAIFWLWAMFDVITTDRSKIRALPKFAWLVLMVLFLEFGALAWVIFGRPRGTDRGSSGIRRMAMDSLNRRLDGAPKPAHQPRGSSGGSGGAPVGPDDDPDFLRGLSK